MVYRYIQTLFGGRGWRIEYEYRNSIGMKKNCKYVKSARSILDVKLLTLLGYYDRKTNRLTNRRTDQVMGKFHFPSVNKYLA